MNKIIKKKNDGRKKIQTQVMKYWNVFQLFLHMSAPFFPAFRNKK